MIPGQLGIDALNSQLDEALAISPNRRKNIQAWFDTWLVNQAATSKNTDWIPPLREKISRMVDDLQFVRAKYRIEVKLSNSNHDTWVLISRGSRNFNGVENLTYSLLAVAN